MRQGYRERMVLSFHDPWQGLAVTGRSSLGISIELAAVCEATAFVWWDALEAF
jgi:hypothetical protein